jgi:hypothetical protein
MEYWMDSYLWRKIQFIYEFTLPDHLKDLEGIEPFDIEFLGGSYRSDISIGESD